MKTESNTTGVAPRWAEHANFQVMVEKSSFCCVQYPNKKVDHFTETLCMLTGSCPWLTRIHWATQSATIFVIQPISQLISHYRLNQTGQGKK